MRILLNCVSSLQFTLHPPLLRFNQGIYSLPFTLPYSESIKVFTVYPSPSPTHIHSRYYSLPFTLPYLDSIKVFTVYPSPSPTQNQSRYLQFTLHPPLLRLNKVLPFTLHPPLLRFNQGITVYPSLSPTQYLLIFFKISIKRNPCVLETMNQERKIYFLIKM